MPSMTCTLTGGAGSDSKTAWKVGWQTITGGRTATSGETVFQDYASPTTYCSVIRFKTPDFPGVATSINFTIPFVRPNNFSSTQSTSGTFYFRLTDYNPTAEKQPQYALPTSASSNHDGDGVSWKSTDFEVHKATGSLDISKSSIKAVGMSPNTTYYLAIGSSALIQVGDDSVKTREDKSKYIPGQEFEIKVNYAYSDGTAPTITSLRDRGDNRILVAGKVGIEGTNNSFKETPKLYYTTDGTDPSSSSTRTSIELPKTSGADYYFDNIYIFTNCTFRVYVECKYKYNTASAKKECDAKYYAAPSKPGIPKLNHKKSRLTIREPWTFTWTAAKQTNSDSPVRGYYIMLLRKAKGTDKFSFINTLFDKGDDKLGLEEEAQTNTNYYMRRAGTSCTAIIEDPGSFGFKAGDSVKLRISAYTTNKAEPVATLQSTTVESEDLVQNAGIVRVKVNNTWKEGQVWVKVAGAWKEAETVNTKVNGVWKESQ